MTSTLQNQRLTRSSPQQGNRNVEVHLYPGAEHGFFTKGRPAFNAAAVVAATVHIERLLSTLT
jgi:dienelactone hydrolase